MKTFAEIMEELPPGEFRIQDVLMFLEMANVYGARREIGRILRRHSAGISHGKKLFVTKHKDGTHYKVVYTVAGAEAARGDGCALGTIGATPQGFPLIEFVDSHGKRCRLEMSTLAENPIPGTSALWLGRSEYCMHLNRTQVQALATHLLCWLGMGLFEVPRDNVPAARARQGRGMKEKT